MEPLRLLTSGTLKLKVGQENISFSQCCHGIDFQIHFYVGKLNDMLVPEEDAIKRRLFFRAECLQSERGLLRNWSIAVLFQVNILSRRPATPPDIIYTTRRDVTSVTINWDGLESGNFGSHSPSDVEHCLTGHIDPTYDVLLKDFVVDGHIELEWRVILVSTAGIVYPTPAASWDTSVTGVTDRILVADGREFHVTAAVLATHSSFFHRRFFDDRDDVTGARHVISSSIPFKYFDEFLSTIYGDVYVTAHNFESLLVWSEEYDTPLVKEEVERALVEADTRTVSLGKQLEMADKHGLDELMRHCIVVLTDAEQINDINLESLSASTRDTILQRLVKGLPERAKRDDAVQKGCLRRHDSSRCRRRPAAWHREISDDESDGGGSLGYIPRQRVRFEDSLDF